MRSQRIREQSHFLNGSIRISCPRLQLARTLGTHRAFVDGAMPASACAPMPIAHSKVCCGTGCLLNPTRKRRALLPRSGIHLWTCACSAYMLAVPVVPGANKSILFAASMERVLPLRVLRRPKSPLTGDPQWDRIGASGAAALIPAFELEKYVDLTRMPDPARSGYDEFLGRFASAGPELLVAEHAEQGPPCRPPAKVGRSRPFAISA